MSKWTAIADGIRQSREKADHRSAESARSQENGLSALYALGRSPVSEVSTPANDDRRHVPNVPAPAPAIAPAERAHLGDALVPEAELIALVDTVADFHGFNTEQRVEAKQVALADPEAALDCFRDLVAKIPGTRSTTDDRITCNQCANLVGHKCMKWNELGAARVWEPIQLPLRCEQFKPDAGDADQRTGAQRWSNLRKIDE